MKRRSLRIPGGGLARRGFLAGALAGGLAVAVVYGGRGGRGRGRGAGETERRGPGLSRTADPWAPMREEVISPDALGPSGDELAG